MSFGISFFGIGGNAGLGAEMSTEDVSTLSVKLAPPKPDFLLADKEFDQLELASTLIDARDQLLAGLSEKPILVPKSLISEVKFIVTKGGGPQGEFEFKIVSGKYEGTVLRADTQTVKLTFKEPDDL